jgi:hypothetical protein
MSELDQYLAVALSRGVGHSPLLQEAGAAGETDAQRRQKLSDRASLDDQPLTASSNQNSR